MDWIVQVKTKSGYIKDVKVFDYNYPNDAVEAALAQTGATEYINFHSVSNDSKSETSSSDNIIYTTSSGGSPPKNALELFGYLVLGFFATIAYVPLGFAIFGWMAYRAIKVNGI